jgi:hypothetical protein
LLPCAIIAIDPPKDSALHVFDNQWEDFITVGLCRGRDTVGDITDHPMDLGSGIGCKGIVLIWIKFRFY